MRFPGKRSTAGKSEVKSSFKSFGQKPTKKSVRKNKRISYGTNDTRSTRNSSGDRRGDPYRSCPEHRFTGGVYLECSRRKGHTGSHSMERAR